ncbi:MAG: plasmid stabilization protein, partial [Halobacteria archaeon]|nr:plasmid stabilization protein [Halobacteria archaeon]
KPSTGKVTDPKPKHNHHAAMTWFLSDMVSLAENGWYGYVNPEPLIPPKKIQKVTDGVAKTTMNAFSPDKILSSGSTRDLGLMLAATGWYGTHAGSDALEKKAKGYADALASKVEENLAGNGMVENGAANQAATQGVVAQGLVYASQIDGVDHVSTAKDVAGYMFDTLWDDDAGTFASGEGDSTYTVTARDAGDITGGVNVADAVVGRSDARKKYARYFNQTFNRGKLQRAQRAVSVDENAEHSLPLPPKAGGKYGQSAVYNAEVEYDAENDEWSVTDDTFRTGDSLYLANQDIWIGRWGGQEFKGRGIPGKTDQPPKKQGQTQ